MKFIQTKLQQIACLLILTVPAATVAAEPSNLNMEQTPGSTNTILPNYYPEMFEHTGIIDLIDIKEGRVVINDMYWRLPMNIKVHNLNTEFSTVHTLRNGMNVGFKRNSVKKNTDIAEIWVLPNNYTQSSRNLE